MKITKGEYLESDLHRDRFNVNSATCRRRSTATYYKSSCANGNISPSSTAYRSANNDQPVNKRRTTSVSTQLTHAEDTDKSDQEIALLDSRQRQMQMNKNRCSSADEDVAV